MQKVYVLSGPNLNMLGSREPEIYGSTTLADIQAELIQVGAGLGLAVECFWSNSESDLVGWMHDAVLQKIPVVINPAAFTHYSYALRDAVAQHTAPVIEVHLSNPHARENFRTNSVISAVVTGTIAGFGAKSYLTGLQLIAELN